MVLRDVWLDDGAKTERQIQESIFSDLQAFGEKLEDPKYEPVHFHEWDEPLEKKVRALFTIGNSGSDGTAGSKKRYKDYFLTILCDSIGDPCTEVASGYQVQKDILREVADGSARKLRLATGADPSRNSQSSASVIANTDVLHQSNVTAQLPRTYRPKRPYRLVYEECCQDLDDKDLKSLQDVFTGFRDCFMGAYMFSCC